MIEGYFNVNWILILVTQTNYWLWLCFNLG